MKWCTLVWGMIVEWDSWQRHNRVTEKVAGNCNGCLPPPQQVDPCPHLIGRSGRRRGAARCDAVSRLRTGCDREGKFVCCMKMIVDALWGGRSYPNGVGIMTESGLWLRILRSILNTFDKIIIMFVSLLIYWQVQILTSQSIFLKHPKIQCLWTFSILFGWMD